MAPLQACIEFCVNNKCIIAACSSVNDSEIMAVVDNNTAMNMTFVHNNTAMNVTELPCLEKVVIRLDEVPFAVSFVIIIILSFAIILYAIAKKRLYGNGVIQANTAE